MARATRGLLGCRPRGLSTTVTQTSPTSPHHPHIPYSPAPIPHHHHHHHRCHCKTKTAAATAAASEGTIAPPVFNLCYSFFLSHSLSSAVLCISLSLSLSPSLLSYPPSSKHFWLFCFPALQRVIAHDNDHGRLFSLGSPASVCTPG